MARTEEQKRKHNEYMKKYRATHPRTPEQIQKNKERCKEYKLKQLEEDPVGFRARRLKDKMVYYQKNANGINSRSRYTEEELQMIMDHTIPDRELAEKLGRSIKAIHVVRSKMKAGLR